MLAKSCCLLQCVYQGYVDASPCNVFKEIVVDIESSPLWNPTLIECRVCMLASFLKDVKIHL